MHRTLFTYPSCFTFHSDYRERSGQYVTVLKLSDKAEADIAKTFEELSDISVMFDVLADDGWIGTVFIEELEETPSLKLIMVANQCFETFRCDPLSDVMHSVSGCLDQELGACYE